MRLDSGTGTGEDAGVFTLVLCAKVMTLAPSPFSASPVDLAISLVFGAGQVVVGSALAWRGLGRGRWRRAALFAMALTGVWVVCSGVAELIVSGLEAMARGWHTPAPQTVAAVRQMADTGLLVAAVLLAVALSLYLVWWRAGQLGTRRRDES